MVQEPTGYSIRGGRTVGPGFPGSSSSSNRDIGAGKVSMFDDPLSRLVVPVPISRRLRLLLPGKPVLLFLLLGYTVGSCPAGSFSGSACCLRIILAFAKRGNVKQVRRRHHPNSSDAPLRKYTTAHTVQQYIIPQTQNPSLSSST